VPRLEAAILIRGACGALSVNREGRNRLIHVLYERHRDLRIRGVSSTRLAKSGPWPLSVTVVDGDVLRVAETEGAVARCSTIVPAVTGANAVSGDNSQGRFKYTTRTGIGSSAEAAFATSRRHAQAAKSASRFRVDMHPVPVARTVRQQ
jgi:hypothetical protein